MYSHIHRSTPCYYSLGLICPRMMATRRLYTDRRRLTRQQYRNGYDIVCLFSFLCRCRRRQLYLCMCVCVCLRTIVHGNWKKIFIQMPFRLTRPLTTCPYAGYREIQFTGETKKIKMFFSLCPRVVFVLSTLRWGYRHRLFSYSRHSARNCVSPGA